MTIEALPFEHLPRNSIANNIDKINELVDWANQADHLSASATGESVTVGNSSSLKGLQVHGKSVQDGTPTPDVPVPVQVVEGSNLLDESSASADTIIYSGGGTGTSAGYKTSGYISVVGGQSYTFSMSQSTLTFVSWYKADQTHIERVQTTAQNATLTAPSNAHYMRFCWYENSVVTWAQIEYGSTATSYLPYGCIGIDVGDTATSINLQGNTLASLPDGTRDELHVDSAGRVWIEKNVGEYVITGQEAGSTSQLGDYYRFYSNVVEDMQAPLQVTQGDINGYCTHSRYEVEYGGQYVHAYVIQGKKFLVYSTNETPLSEFVGAELYYPLATTQTIDLGYIDPPAIPGGSVVTISASLTPEFRLEWWVESGITDVIEDLKAYVDYKTEG